MPTPHQLQRAQGAQGAQICWLCKRTWGALRFGVARAEPSDFVSVVIDATEHG